MDTKIQRKISGILSILNRAGRPLGGKKIAQELEGYGIDLSQRTVCHYLGLMDRLGFTRSYGKRGRVITDVGRRELESGLIVDKLGFVASRVDTLSYKMSFNVNLRRGKIILNISTLPRNALQSALKEINNVYAYGLSMGKLVALGRPGTSLGEFKVPADQYAVGTICSLTINGVLLRANIATTSRFGGLLEFRDHKPLRFTHMINYDGTTLDPLEIFIKGKMTRVKDILETGNGVIGASFREVPAVALPDVKTIIKKLEKIGLAGVLLIGRAKQSLLDIPVAQGRAGLIVVGGLSPMSAVEESGIPTHNMAMNTLFEFENLIPYNDLVKELETGD